MYDGYWYWATGTRSHQDRLVRLLCLSKSALVVSRQLAVSALSHCRPSKTSSSIATNRQKNSNEFVPFSTHQDLHCHHARDIQQYPILLLQIHYLELFNFCQACQSASQVNSSRDCHRLYSTILAFPPSCRHRSARYRSRLKSLSSPTTCPAATGANLVLRRTQLANGSWNDGDGILSIPGSE